MHERRLTSRGLPNHVAIIMDGNGRWAERRGLSRVEGHRAGLESVREVVTWVWMTIAISAPALLGLLPRAQEPALPRPEM